MSELSEFDAPPAPAVLNSAPAPVLWVEHALGLLAGLILLVTMAMTAIDVAGRYLLGRPLGFAYEVTELLMAAVFFIALASVTLRGEHITIGLFKGFWTGRIGAARDLVVALSVVIGTGYLCYRMMLFTGRFYDFGDRTNVLRFPLYPVAAVGAVGVGLASAAGLVLVADALRRIARGGR
ncbi:MAG: TRAP transporter small permease [Pseudorhodoplanes sp.]